MLRAVLLALAALGAVSGDAVQRGREIFTHGRAASGATITALVEGAASIDAALVPCANCHGVDGRGTSEGGIRAPDITAAALADAATVGARKRTAYTPAKLKRAITLGFDASGNALDRAMPRFALTARDAEDLIAYLGVLGKEAEPGVAEHEIRIGVTGDVDVVAPQTRIYGRAIRLVRGGESDVFAAIDVSPDGTASIERAEREHVPTLVLNAAQAEPEKYAFVLTASAADAVAALRAAVPASTSATTFTNGCAGIERVDPAGFVLMTAGAAKRCDIAAIPPSLDRRVLVAAGYPPGNDGAAAAGALALLVGALADLGRDATRARLLTALEALRDAPVAGIAPVTWSPGRHFGTRRAWVMTLDVGAQRLLAAPGWSAALTP